MLEVRVRDWDIGRGKFCHEISQISRDFRVREIFG